MYKIGRTKDLDRRLKELGVGVSANLIKAQFFNAVLWSAGGKKKRRRRNRGDKAAAEAATDDVSECVGGVDGLVTCTISSREVAL